MLEKPENWKPVQFQKQSGSSGNQKVAGSIPQLYQLHPVDTATSAGRETSLQIWTWF